MSTTRACGALHAVTTHLIGDHGYGRSGSLRDPFGPHWQVTSQPRGEAVA